MLLELNNLLYSLCDADDYLGVTIAEDDINELGLSPRIGGPYLHMKTFIAKLIGLTEIYVGNSMNAVNMDFEILTEKMLKMFESKARVYDNFNLFIKQVQTLKLSMFSVSQQHSCFELLFVSPQTCFIGFPCNCALFPWIFHTHSDVFYFLNQAEQVCKNTFSSEKIQGISRVIKLAKRTSELRFKIFAPDFDAAHKVSSMSMTLYVDK